LPDLLSARLAEADIPIHLDVGESDGPLVMDEELAE
jgi:hypothetical protein